MFLTYPIFYLFQDCCTLHRQANANDAITGAQDPHGKQQLVVLSGILLVLHSEHVLCLFECPR